MHKGTESYWLLKTEPSDLSIDMLHSQGRVVWDGVRNFAARKNLRSMQRGDLVLIHHSSVKEPAIVGLGEVVETAYPDPSQFDKKSQYYDPRSKAGEGIWSAIDIQFVHKFTSPVFLKNIREDKRFKSMTLVHEPRLSVQAVEAVHFNLVKTLGK